MRLLRRIGAAIVLATLTGAHVPAAAAQNSPVQFLRDLMLPRALGPPQTFQPRPENVPLPRPRPARKATPQLASPSTAANATCLGALAASGVEARILAPIADGRCGIAEPVKVTAFAGGTIALSEPAILTCSAVLSLAGWLDGDVRPAARSTFNGEVTGLHVAASYACRSRNSQSGTKLSEHAKGHAIDIAAFQISGHGWLNVGSENGARQRFLADIRGAACGPFTTVLGPGSDEFHTDHFHLDTARRGKNGRSLYCR